MLGYQRASGSGHENAPRLTNIIPNEKSMKNDAFLEAEYIKRYRKKFKSSVVTVKKNGLEESPLVLVQVVQGAK